MSNAVPIIRAEGEGESLAFAGGGLMTLKATSSETNSCEKLGRRFNAGKYPECVRHEFRA